MRGVQLKVLVVSRFDRTEVLWEYNRKRRTSPNYLNSKMFMLTEIQNDKTRESTKNHFVITKHCCFKFRSYKCVRKELKYIKKSVNNSISQ